MKKLTIILLFICAGVFGQTPSVGDTLANGFQDYDHSIYDWVDDSADYAGNILYINLSLGIGGDGSYGNPYGNWNDVPQSNGVAYAFKRGSSTAGDLIINTDNNLVCAYGVGTTPNLTKMVLEGEGTTVRDLKFRSYFDVGQFNDPKDNTILFNTEHEAQVTCGGGDFKMLGCYVHDTYVDGVYPRNTSSTHADFEMAYTRITRVNLKWFDDPSELGSPGDGIQIQSYLNSHIHHCIIDRSYTGNKFNVIVGDYSTSPTTGPYYATFEYNTMVLPKPGPNGGTGIYAGDGPMIMTMRNNIIYSTSTETGYGIYLAHAASTYYVYGNIIYGMKYDIKNGGTNYIFNNTTDDLSSSEAYSWTNYAKNNIVPSDPGGMDASNIFIDELTTSTNFVDYANNNYRLLETSVAVGAGTNDATTADRTEDIDRTPVPVTGLSIGAFEYAEYEYINIDTVYSEYDDGVNVAAYTIDNNRLTRLSFDEREGKVVFVLDSLRDVDSIAVDFYLGDARQDTFKIDVSYDSVNWSNSQLFISDGATDGYEYFTYSDQARYVRYTGLGNSSSAWNSINEFRVFGDVGVYCGLDLNPTIKNDSNSKCLGSIELSVSGGVAPYSYLWSTGDITPLTDSLCEGEYWVQVTDNIGCEKTDTFIIRNLVDFNGGIPMIGNKVAAVNNKIVNPIFTPYSQDTCSVNGVLDFDGVDDLVSFSDDVSLIQGTKTVTGNIFLRSTTTGTTSMFLNLGGDFDGILITYFLNYLSFGDVFLITDGKETYIYDAAPYKEQPIEFIINKTSSGLTDFKINGISQSSLGITGTSGTSDVIRIGGGESSYCNGVLIWDVSINDGVSDIFNVSGQPNGNTNGAWVDNAGSNDGTVNGNPNITNICE